MKAIDVGSPFSPNPSGIASAGRPVRLPAGITGGPPLTFGSAGVAPEGAWPGIAGSAWVDLPKKGKIHAWTTCYFGSEAFLKETPYNLALVEFEGAGSLLLVRLKDAKQDDLYIGQEVEARFEPKAKYSVTDVWFVPASAESTKAR